MKHILLIFALALCPLLLAAQAAPILQFYDKYKELDKVTDLKLQGWVLEMASIFSEGDDSKNLLRKISRLRVLLMEEGNLVSPGEYRQLMKDVKKASFETLMKIKEGDEQIDLLIREQGDTITDVLLIVSGLDNFVLLSLEGALKFSDLNDLNIEVEGAEHFKKLPEKKADIPQA
jgi:hypothetical protein